MASRGPYVVFKRVRRAATKAKPYLVPGGEVGFKVMKRVLRRQIATLRSLDASAILGAGSLAARLGAFAALKAAQRRAPKGTSSPGLRSSLNARKETDVLWSVGSNKDYARFVEEGTRAGTRNGPYIYPKMKQALAFYWRNAPPAVRARFRGRRGRRR